MKINSGFFCSLSSAPFFLNWLSKYYKDIYQELVAHLRQSKSCKENALKMLSVLNNITSTDDGEALLGDFLREKFPQALIAEDKVDEVPVFGHYDPGLLTIPRRMILSSETEALKFLASKAIGDYVVVDSKAYIEFLPLDLLYLASAIPDKNWLVRVWKSSHQQN